MSNEIIPAIISAVPASVAAFAALDTRRLGKHNRAKLTTIDDAVNGAAVGDDSIRQNVQTLVRRSNGGDGVSSP